MIGLDQWARAVDLGRVDESCRIVVDLRGIDAGSLDAIRMLLMADVARRTIEDLRAGHVLLVRLEDSNRPTAAWATSHQALWIRDPTARTPSRTRAAMALGGSADVLLTAARPKRGEVEPSSGRRILRIGPVTIPAHATRSLSDVLAGDQALAVRLALLRFPASGQAALSSARLHRAQETLHRWQFKVAYWAELPTAPAPPGIADALRAALGELDTATVLKLLHRLEVDLHVAAGSKFDAFALADRALGVDLRHLVGKLRR